MPFISSGGFGISTTIGTVVAPMTIKADFISSELFKFINDAQFDWIG